MAIANHFYHETTRRYIALFGSIFNKLTIIRRDNARNQVQRMIVPVGYGPYQKFLARLKQDPKLDQKSAITLPRISFEITGMDYDGSRKLPVVNKIHLQAKEGAGKGFVYSPTPYNIHFNMYIMTKNGEDATQIVEQVLPFFSPEWTPSVHILDSVKPIDVPIVYNGLSIEEIYEGAFTERRAIVWTLSFTLKGYYFKPDRNKGVIKFVDVRMDDAPFIKGTTVDRSMTQPGLTEDGRPTASIDNTIHYQLIEEYDDWDVINRVEAYVVVEDDD